MIAIIDYGMGNLHTVRHKFERLKACITVADSPDGLRNADGLILPGVGHFKAGMRNLRERGLDVAIREAAAGGMPVFGICLGCQLLCDHSEEGDVPGLGLIRGNVVRFFGNGSRSLKVPHMGWNTIKTVRPDPLLEGVNEDDFFYFVHSYHLCDVEEEAVLGTTGYGGKFCSVVRKGPVMGTQFHPEKSHDQGLVILKNFLETC